MVLSLTEKPNFFANLLAASVALILHASLPISALSVGEQTIGSIPFQLFEPHLAWLIT